MAYTKIHAVNAAVSKAITYICNPEKTDGSILISSYGCSPETASYDFTYTLSKTRQSDPNKAFHLIQAFKPGEVSYEEAHRIGIELADKLLERKHSYVVSTHIDKGHVHNHIIFCAANNIDHGKYNDCKKSYYRIRRLSDALCAEHGLSVISPSGERGKNYREWLALKNGNSWKWKLKKDIDDAIKTAETYEECIALIRAKGYEIKGESLEENALKYISFRPLDRERFVRGSEKSLGTEYTKERIRERIAEKALTRDKKQASIPNKPKVMIQDYGKKKLIDTKEGKFTESPGLKRWADTQNLKSAAAAYREAGSLAELEQEISAKSKLVKTARESLVSTEHQLTDMTQILKYAKQYQDTHTYHFRYQKSKDKDRYFRQHETELLLHDGAENMLESFGINPKNMNIEKLQERYNALYAKKQSLQKNYKEIEKETAALNRKADTLRQYLAQDQQKQAVNQPKEKKQEIRL